jgi:hypothetical protein
VVYASKLLANLSAYAVDNPPLNQKLLECISHQFLTGQAHRYLSSEDLLELVYNLMSFLDDKTKDLLDLCFKFFDDNQNLFTKMQRKRLIELGNYAKVRLSYSAPSSVMGSVVKHQTKKDVMQRKVSYSSAYLENNYIADG